MTTNVRRTGFEISEEVEASKKTILERMIPGKRQVIGFITGMIPLVAVFLVGCWLAGNPFDSTWRAQDSAYNINHGLVGTNQWHIVWYVVVIGLFFEFMDASAGMGFGTVMSPVLMSLGFTPLQVVPVIMIQQGTAGLVGAFLHREFENVEWKFNPMSETVKLWLLISVLGVAAVIIFHHFDLCYFCRGKGLDQTLCHPSAAWHGTGCHVPGLYHEQGKKALSVQNGCRGLHFSPVLIKGSVVVVMDR